MAIFNFAGSHSDYSVVQMGKDLSTVAMPIALNEPINLLQKLCEELEYCELLDRAAKTTDTVERLCLVAGMHGEVPYCLSTFAETIFY